jgi:hypothetical protein
VTHTCRYLSGERTQIIHARAPLISPALRWEGVAEADRQVDPSSEKAQRREARALVGAYHQEQLRVLLEHVRQGFVQLDAGEIDEFEIDDLIHRYKRAARQLWSFCGSSGGQWLQAAAALTYMRDRGDGRDWWAESDHRR